MPGTAYGTAAVSSQLGTAVYPAILTKIHMHHVSQPYPSFYILLLLPILILVKWPYYLLLIDYLKVSPYLFPKQMSTNINVLSPLQHVPNADGSGNIAPHHHCSSSTHMDSQTLPTHSVSFFLSQSRLSSLWDAAVVSPPDLPVETLGPHAPITTVLLYTYSTQYPICQHLYAIYIIATTDMFFCCYSTYPCNRNPMSTLYTH